MQKVLIGLAGCLLSAAVYAQTAPGAVRVRVGDVKDTRTTGEFFAKLEIELIAMGDVLSDAARFRARVTRAVDETGRDLLDAAKSDAKFEEIGGGAGQAKTTVKLKNPSRRAMTVKVLAGELDIFAPARDPQSTVTVPNFVQHAGTPLTGAPLRAAGATVTQMTKADYDAYKAAQEQRAKAAAAEDAGEALGQAFAEAFGQLFAGFTSVGDNSVILKVEDPQARIIDFEFEDAQGTELSTSSRMTVGDVRVYNFRQPVPADARARIYLATEKSLVTVPFQLVDIVLP